MLNRISALVLRYLYVYRRSWLRATEIIFWPIVDLLVWGFVTSYLQQLTVPRAVTFMIGGMIFWDILFRAQQSIAVSILQDMWVGNILNVFIAPVRTAELLSATCIIGILRSGITAIIIGALAWAFYSFNILELGFALAPLVANLLLFGWVVGIFTTALILRYGEAVESVAWAIPFLLQPFCAAFYPVASLPQGLRYVAYCLPCTYSFEGMRALLQQGRFDVGLFLAGLGLNVIFLVLTSMFLMRMLRIIRERGYLTRSGRG